MAEPASSAPSPSAGSDTPSNPACDPPPQQDWEVLSLSMSASAFGTPGSASVVCSCDACTGNFPAGDAQHAAPPLSQHFTLPLSHSALVSSENSLISRVADQSNSGGFEAGVDPQAGGVRASKLDSHGRESDLLQDEWLEKSDKVALGEGSFESGLRFGEWPADNRGAEHDGRRMLSASDVEPFTEGWKLRSGIEPPDLVFDPLPGVYNAYTSYAETDPSEAGDNSFPSDIPDEHTTSVESPSADADIEPLENLREETPPAEENVAEEEKISGVENKLDTPDEEPIGRERSVEPSKKQPCQAWWKRQAGLLRVQVREANTLWSIALAATVMGLVVLGQRWQRERSQNQQLRLQLGAKDEKISDLLYQVTRLKDAITGRRRVPVRVSTGYGRFSEY